MLHNKEIWIYRNDYQWKFPCKLLNTAINTTFSNLPRITFGSLEQKENLGGQFYFFIFQIEIGEISNITIHKRKLV